VCQSLYEKHKLITYPRSDCRYLPSEHYNERDEVVRAIRNNDQSLASAVDKADKSLKSSAWNNAKVGAHHAIIPTVRQCNSRSLSDHEIKVYRLVATQYLAQFYPAHEYIDTKVHITIAGGEFLAGWKKVVEPGWKVLFENNSKPEKDPPAPPPLKKGQPLHCERGELVEKNTTPPAYFTDATLLAAMTGISRYVKEEEIRKILRETDGLGTEATRAGIIELLLRRGLMQRKGKQIHDTPAGRALIKSLPEVAVVPDMTAQWEALLNKISQDSISYLDFMQPLEEHLRQLIAGSAASSMSALQGVQSVARPKAGKKRSSKKKRAKKKTSRAQSSGQTFKKKRTTKKA